MGLLYIEPRVDGDDKSRTDGHLFFHVQTAMFDVSVVDPSAKSYRYAQRPLGTATRAETMKSEQYAARCREQGHLFFPAILECFGAIGVKCKDLVGKIDEEAALNGVPKIHGVRVKTYLLRALSFGLQRKCYDFN